MDTQMIYSLIEDAKPRVRAYLRDTDKEAWRDLAICSAIVLGSIKFAFWMIDNVAREPAPAAISCPTVAAIPAPTPAPVVASVPEPLPPPKEWMDTKPIVPLVAPPVVDEPVKRAPPPVEEGAPKKEIARTVSRYCQRHPYRRACRD